MFFRLLYWFSPFYALEKSCFPLGEKTAYRMATGSGLTFA